MTHTMDQARQIWTERFTTLDRVLLIVSVVSAVLFMALRPMTPFPGDIFLKALPVAYLALLSLKHVTGSHGVWLAVALGFSAAGDIVLEYNPRAFFVYGLALFLMAHVCYIVLFKKDFAFRAYWLPVAALTALYGAGIAAYLVPRLGGLLFPVLVYILAIAGMGIFAAFRVGANLPIFLGALFFLCSDSFIALNRFTAPDAVTPLLIMPTYYIAQFLIACGYIFDPRYAPAQPEEAPNYLA